MNLKIFQSLMQFIVCILVIGCNNNSSDKNAEVKSNSRDSIQPSNSDTSAASTYFSPLPKSARPLHTLPANIKEFVEKIYPGYRIIIAVSDPLCQGGDAIDVTVAKKSSPNLSLIFKPDGSFVQQEEDVQLSSAPDKIREALDINYADYSPGNQIEKLILADKTVQYLVGLNQQGITKEVIFDTDGNVVCEN